MSGVDVHAGFGLGGWIFGGVVPCGNGEAREASGGEGCGTEVGTVCLLRVGLGEGGSGTAGGSRGGGQQQEEPDAGEAEG